MHATAAPSELTGDIHLQLGDEIVAWNEILNQLQVFGRLKPLLIEIASQKILLDEIRSRVDLELDPAALDAAITDFRQQRQLTDDEAFRAWLAAEKLDYASFRMRMYFRCKLKVLKTRLVEPLLADEFRRQESSLEQVRLSYLIAQQEATAQDLARQLHSGESSFEEVASREAANPELVIKHNTPPLMRSWLADNLRSVLEGASPQQLVGPVQVEGQWIVAMIHAVIPAQLDAAMESRLGQQLFQRWLQTRLEGYTIRLGSSMAERSDPIT